LFSIDTPPPTVSGNLHIGHIFSYTQTDIIARYKRLCEYHVLYPFGFDDNGLATERYVEKKCGVRAVDMSRSDFIALCMQETEHAEKLFQQVWNAVGLSAQGENAYRTISAQARGLAQASFIELYKKGFVYRQNEPALYCTTCRTSVAQAELDDHEEKSFFNTIPFMHESGQQLFIGTTRPELLPSCVALLYHPTDERYVKLAGTHAKTPLFDISVPILADELVDKDKGTGLVMVCTFGDTTDIIWYKKHHLSYRQSLDAAGRFMPHTDFLAGLKVKDARVRIIQKLVEAGLLQAQKEIVHTINVHERCQQPIEFFMLPQWFISIVAHKKKLLELADECTWYPAFMKSRYQNWVENIAWDWCISRQRYFGIPFPCWHCQQCNALILADEKSLPIDPQNSKAPACSSCGSTEVVPDIDVMDTWNTSSLTPYLCGQLYYGKELPLDAQEYTSFLPMSMRPQAHDLIRTWAFYTIAKTWMHHGTIPWKDIVISGHVLSDSKQKLSKSKEGGKTLTPEGLLQQYPADAIRYWTACARLGTDVAFSQEQIKIGSRLVTKLWNAFRFALPHIEQLSAQKSVPKNIGTVNEWILHQISAVFVRYQENLDVYEFGPALEAVEQFFWCDFCDNYLECIKHQLFNPDQYTSDTVFATRWTLAHICRRILQLYAPYVPYITEALYQEHAFVQTDALSVHQTNYANVQIPYVFADSAYTMTALLQIIQEVRKLKTEHKLALNSPLAQLEIFISDDDMRHSIGKEQQLLRGVTQAEHITLSENTAEKNMLEQKNGQLHATVSLSL
ncbi:MAG TPA: valine--tRNA ligase, partial [Candidatus Bathyarchaeia archaeon]|nr:valine--tRNA ligase [Candidatus Bathyarchaeia archaeon]